MAVYASCRGGLFIVPWLFDSAPTKPFGPFHCHFCNLVCSNYCEELTIFWKICCNILLMTHHTSRYVNANLRKSSFGSVGKFWFSSAIVKYLVPWICYFFQSNHKVHSAHMALSHFWFAFVTCLKQDTLHEANEIQSISLMIFIIKGDQVHQKVLSS